MKIWRPYTQMFQALAPEKISHASGSYLYLSDGRKVLDGISSWWLITHGHCHPLISEAIEQQTKKLHQVVFANFIHEPAEQFIDALSSFLPEKLSAAFFSDNGSTAVEAAMKMAYQYCQQTNRTQKKKFVSFTHSYHGDTCGAMSVTADGTYTTAYQGLRIEVIRCKQGERSSDPPEGWLRDIRHTLETRHHEIAAVIIEPLLQGAGGMVAWTPEVVQTICNLCKQYDVLVIFDEVMTGFGRTGSMFAFEQVGFVPDFLCLSKGITGGFLPLGLTVTIDGIYEAFLSQESSKMLFHGHSFTGNAISCAAACANLEIFRTTNVLEKISDLKTAHERGIRKLKEKNSLRDSRIIGSIGAVELNLENAYGGNFSKSLFQYCLKKGLFIRTLGNVVYLMPPYCTTSQEVEDAWQLLAEGAMLSSL